MIGRAKQINSRKTLATDSGKIRINSIGAKSKPTTDQFLSYRIIAILFAMFGLVFACKLLGINIKMLLMLVFLQGIFIAFKYGLHGIVLFAFVVPMLGIQTPLKGVSLGYFTFAIFLSIIIIKLFEKQKIVFKPCIPLLIFLIIIVLNYIRIGVDFPFTDIGNINFSVFLKVVSCIIIYLCIPVLFFSMIKIKHLYLLFCVKYIIYLLDSWCIFLGFGGGVFHGQLYSETVFKPVTEAGSFIRFGCIGSDALFLFPLVLVFFRPNNLLQRNLKYLVIGFLWLSLMFSGGRSHLAASILMFGTYCMLTLKARKFALVLLGLCLLFVMLQTSGFLFTNLIDSINSRILDREHLQKTMGKFETAERGRLNTWYLSWRIALENPIIGKGPPSRQREKTYHGMDAIKHAYEGTHAAFFNILAINGFPALVLYLTGLFMLFKKLIIVIRFSEVHSFFHQNAVFLLLWFLGLIWGSIWGGIHYGGSDITYLFFGLIGGSFYLFRKSKNLGLVSS